MTAPALAVVAIGLLALAGWFARIDLLRSALGPSPPVHPGTAACLVLLGIGLALLGAARPPRTLVALLGGAVVVACPWFILTEVGLVPVSGRMSALTGVALAAGGLGLVVAAVRQSPSVLGVAAMPAIVLSLCSLLGHWLGLREFPLPYVAVSNQMAYLTAAGLLAWAYGAWRLVLAAHPSLLAWNRLPEAAATGGLTLVLGLDVIHQGQTSAAAAIDLVLTLAVPIFCYVVARQMAELRRRRLEAEANSQAFESTLEGMATLDGAGRVRWANPALGLLVASEPDDLRGGHFGDWLDPPHRLRFQHALVEAARAGKAGVEVPLRRCGGDSVWLETKVVRTPGPPEGGAAGFRLFVADISARKAAERMKDEFLGVFAHDIRNPLSALGLAIEMLDDPAMGADPAQRERLLGVARNSYEKLHHLASDILDRERMASGLVSLAARECLAADLVRQAVEAVEPIAADAGIRMTWRAAPDLRVEADAARTLQVLHNLLENAMQVAPPGSGVDVAAESLDGEAVFTVGDEGPGIPEDKLKAVFDRFERLPGSGAARGDGLGLAICRNLVERQGGAIWAESAAGRAGARIRFTLPLAARSTPAFPPMG